jgi:hypothetical protein
LSLLPGHSRDAHVVRLQFQDIQHIKENDAVRLLHMMAERLFFILADENRSKKLT